MTGAPELSAARRADLRIRLLDWYGRHRRDLPWRRTRDPYRIWLSETMLQQTRVETVIPYYERFAARFPDAASLADADEQEVLKLWEGLGYYSRARNLKRAAVSLVRDHGGALPRDPEALAALPGIGRYTQGAIRSIAWDEAVPIVDGNVRRVLSRWLARPALSEREQWELAAQLVQGERPGDFNQALMELGATICTPRNPRCLLCPVREPCAAVATGRPEAFPAPRPRAAPREVQAVAGALRRGGRWLLLRRPSRGLLGGLWELPSGDDEHALLAELASRTGLRAGAGSELGSVRHVFTHRALALRVIALEPRGGRLRRDCAADARWCTRAQIDALPLSRLMHKAIALLGGGPGGRGL
jgi:A/G-specific adenine glycosylase